MNFKNIKFFILFSFFSALLLSGCATDGKFGTKKFKHNTPLIKEDIKKKGKIEVDKTAKMGPKPAEADVIKLGKRKQISSQKARNYLLIGDEYELLKQNISFNFKNLDYRTAIELMAKAGEINILVGDEVAGSVTAQLIDIPWDKAFNALLDLKNYAADFVDSC